MEENNSVHELVDKKEAFFRKTPVVLFGALIFCFLWGSAFPCIKIGYNFFGISSDQTGTQILFGGIRFVLAGLLALTIGSLMEKKILVPKKENWLRVLKLSSLQTVGQYVLFYIGLAHTSGVRSSIVEGSNVFVAILVASLIFRQEKLTKEKIIGSILGFSGVVLVSISGKGLGDGNFWSGDLLVFLSTLCYAFSSVYLKKYSKQENPIVLSGWQFVIGGVIMSIVGFVMGGRLTQISGKGIASLGYLAFISAVAYSLWGLLLKYNPISKVAVFGFMNPVFGVILSSVFLQEGSVLGWMSVVALVLICAGIFIVNFTPWNKNGES